MVLIKLPFRILSIFAVIFLTACAQSTAHVAQNNGFKQKYIQTTTFKLNSYQKLQQTAAPVYIYIEGDGHVLQSNFQVAKDPSPHSPLTMQLAAQDPSLNVVYLARPCQYSPDDLNTVCNSKYWTDARYSASVVNALNEAITSIKASSGARHIHLIGYSGGGALAILIAAQRNDIASIRTVAGNLDLTTMQEHHKSAPLTESLDPLSVAKKTRNIPQIHFVGAKDNVVPPKVAESFRRTAGLNSNQIIVLKDVGHNSGWSKRWPELLKYVP